MGFKHSSFKLQVRAELPSLQYKSSEDVKKEKAKLTRLVILEPKHIKNFRAKVVVPPCQVKLSNKGREGLLRIMDKVDED